MANPSERKAIITAVVVESGVSVLSGLTKKTVYADKLLATIVGVTEGDRVSYADLTRGLHKYIKDHDLKKLTAAVTGTATVPLAASGPPEVTRAAVPVGARVCRDCGAEIPAEAIFCDLCGANQ